MMSDPVTYFSRLDADECWALLSAAQVGRIAWSEGEEIIIVPVNFVVDGSVIVFHTAPGTTLARLVEPTPVSFQVDDIDTESAIGWSVLVRGRSGPAGAAPRNVSWAGGDRTVGIAMAATHIDGRVVSGTTTSEELHHD